MEKLNIAELLKGCPKGMELDCASYDNVSFDKISDDKKATYPIFCYITDKEGNRSSVSFTENGCESKRYGAKCVIYPKGKTTWEGFVPPCKFRNGDVVTWKDSDLLIASIYKERKNTTGFKHHVALYKETLGFIVNGEAILTDDQLCFATEEEKKKLFDAIKANGYKWNPETKTLEKFVEPKFKVGDKVIYKGESTVITITDVKDNYYFIKFYNPRKNDYQTERISFKDQDDWELVPNKFDITTLKPFDKVLVRDGAGFWRPSLFGKDMIVGYRYFTACGNYKECIPYENNEHLLGTRNDCDDFYKTWEK